MTLYYPTTAPITRLTQAEAAARARGCQPMSDLCDNAMLMIDRDMSEVARVHYVKQIWLTADGKAVSHYEVGVPAMGVVFVGTAFECLEAARREIHAWMEAQLGRRFPSKASMHSHGGWFADEQFVVGRRRVFLGHTVTAAGARDAGLFIADAWAEWQESETAGAQDLGEFGLRDAPAEPLNVLGAIPFDHAEVDVAGDDAPRLDAVGLGVVDDETADIEILRGGDDFTGRQAVKVPECVCGRAALGPQGSLLSDGVDDVERLTKSVGHQIGPADGATILAKHDRRRTAPHVPRLGDDLFLGLEALPDIHSTPVTQLAS